MRFVDLATLVAASWIILSLSAAAQDSNSQANFEQRFATANVTHDGCLTRPQAAQGDGLKWVVRNFAAIDVARRGCVSLDQIKQFRLNSKFATANTTHDGCLTRQQAIAGDMKQVVRHFDEIDTSRRGCVTLEQVNGFMPRDVIAGRFATANSTHDGCLTLDQAVRAGLRSVVQNFSQIDTSGRGCITLGQMRSYFEEKPSMERRPNANVKGGIM